MKSSFRYAIGGAAVTRARLLAMASGAAVMGALPAPARAQASQALRVGVLSTESAAEPHYANDLGYFAKAGLDVTITTMSNTPSIVAAIVAGALDIGYTTIDSVASIHSHNVPLVVIAPATDYIDPASVNTVGVLVRPDSPIRTAKDLKGKTIATPALHSLGTTGASAWIDANGGDSSTVSYVEIPFPAQPAALGAGRVDGVFEVEPFFGAAAKNFRVLFSGYSAISKHFTVNLWVTTPDWARAHADLVKRFVSVIHETAVWANSHHEQSGVLLAKYSNIPVETIAAMVRSHYAEEMTPAILQPGIDASAKYNGFPTFPASALLLSPDPKR
jgi:NitT/TauT family transport system substrate-binding protein